MTEKAVILDKNAMTRVLARISYEIIERNKGVDNLVLVGILSRGGEIAKRIADKIEEVEGSRVPIGMLDITHYRDDVKTAASYLDQSIIHFDLNEKRVVLIDDVIFTGRSVRAAIDGIMGRGRPENIQLAVLIDRGHRELPIRADYIGKNVPTSKNEQVHVRVSERDGMDQVVIME